MPRTKDERGNGQLRVDEWARGWLNGTRERDGARASVTVFLVSGINAIDTFAARRSSEPSQRAALEVDEAEGARTVTAVTTIRRPVEVVYEFFRDLRNFPRFMAHLDSVEPRGPGRSRWRMRGVGGRTFDWEAEIIEERPGQLLAWRSLPGADVDNRGAVRFVAAPGGRGTEVHADIQYAAPAGALGVLVATLLGFEPGQQARGDLRRLKQVLETGEVVHSDASIHRFMHAAQPPTEEFVNQHAAGEAA